MEFDAIPTEEC